jgi:hypothetical protein
MFSFFSSKKSDDEMQKARELFEKVASSQSDTRDARNLRVKMGMLCRAHLDKSFVTGAEQMASWQELSSLAIANGKEKPPLPEPSVFQKIKAGVNEVYVYLPEEYAHEAFSLGARYQRTEMTAIQAIEAMQGLANQICFYELRLMEPFQALQFLRDELSQSPDNTDTSDIP